MEKKDFIVEEVFAMETFSRGGSSTNKVSVLLNYKDGNSQLYMTFYGEKVGDAITLKKGDEINVGYTIKSSKSQSGYWGTYVTGIFVSKLRRAEDAPETVEQYNKEIVQAEQEYGQNMSSIGLDSGLTPGDDLPF